MNTTSSSYAIGIDIGGTTTKLALVNTCGELHTIKTVPTESDRDAGGFLEHLFVETENLIKKVEDQGPNIRGIGISVAGFINPERTTMVFNPNIAELEGYPITPAFEARFQLPAILEVDSNCATLGEYHFGAGREAKRFICLAIGTGVGGGMTIDGQLLRFAYECMGDMGHVIVQPGGPSCGVGCKGCAEGMVSAPAIVRRTMEGLPANPSSVLQNVLANKGVLGTRDVILAAGEGDSYAKTILEETGRWLGLAMASLSAIFLPDCITLAGGVSEAGDLLLKPAELSFRANSGSFYHENVRVCKAELGWKATVLGAASPFL